MLNAAERFIPSSLKSASACALSSESMRMLMFAVVPATQSSPLFSLGALPKKQRTRSLPIANGGCPSPQ